MDRDRRRHGGTSATIGRYVHYNRHATQVCVADPAASVFHRNWHDAAVTTADGPTSRIEGIGRPRVEPSFIRSVIDRMEVVEDKASIAAARFCPVIWGVAWAGRRAPIWWPSPASPRKWPMRGKRLDRLDPVRCRRALWFHLLQR
jgi:hypothetical protein